MTPAGTSNELDVQNGWEENTHTHTHDGMRACELLDNRVCLGWFTVEQVLRQGCMLVPLLFNIFFAAVIKVANTRFKANNDIMDALVPIRKKKRAGGAGGSNCLSVSPGDAANGAYFMLTMPGSSRDPKRSRGRLWVWSSSCAQRLASP